MLDNIASALTTNTASVSAGKTATRSMSRLLTIIEDRITNEPEQSNRIPFPHPGETIREDYLKPSE